MVNRKSPETKTAPFALARESVWVRMQPQRHREDTEAQAFRDLRFTIYDSRGWRKQ